MAWKHDGYKRNLIVTFYFISCSTFILFIFYFIVRKMHFFKHYLIVLTYIVISFWFMPSASLENEKQLRGNDLFINLK